MSTRTTRARQPTQPTHTPQTRNAPSNLDKQILALLLREIEQQQTTRVELAARLGCTTSAVGQVLSGKHAISLRTVERYLGALGRELIVKLEELSPPVYHYYFPGDGKSFAEDYDPSTLRTGCGVPIVKGHVMPELNHVTCEACLEAYRMRDTK